MAVDPSGHPGLWVDIASGALFIVLGAWVLTVRPRRKVTVAFAAFAAAYGLYFILLNLGPDYLGVLPPWTTLAHGVVELLWSACLIGVGLSFPQPLRRQDRAAMAVALTGAFVLLVVVLATATTDPAEQGVLAGGLEGGALTAYTAMDNLAYVGLAFFLVLVTLRPDPTLASRRGAAKALAAVFVSFMAYYGTLFGAFCTMAVRGQGDAAAAIGNFAYLAVAPLLGVAWLVRVARAPAAGRWALAAGLSCFLFPLIGAILPYLVDDVLTSGWLGLSRIVGVAVLAYAILRQQLFDLDVRVKVSLRHGTVAGVFLGVFLIVEQLVQGLTTQTFGLWAGALAAGLLLLLLHPLQNLSRRIADGAMPHVKEAEPAYLLDRKHDIYRDAYASVWMDGVVTRQEMVFLFKLRDSLGLSAQACAAIEAEWNRTMRSASVAQMRGAAAKA